MHSHNHPCELTDINSMFIWTGTCFSGRTLQTRRPLFKKTIYFLAIPLHACVKNCRSLNYPSSAWYLAPSNSVIKSPSCGANTRSRSASQEISPLLLNPKVQCCSYCARIRVLSWTIWIQSSSPIEFNHHSDTIPQQCLSLPFSFPIKMLCAFPSPTIQAIRIVGYQSARRSLPRRRNKGGVRGFKKERWAQTRRCSTPCSPLMRHWSFFTVARLDWSLDMASVYPTAPSSSLWNDAGSLNRIIIL
jgi:hypothetical protein